MPSRNIVKLFVPDQYYHVYNRGVAKKTIFHDSQDYAVFLNLIKRYLDNNPHTDKQGREYEHLRGKVELLAYCLMPNHFHLLFYLIDEAAITKLLRGVCTAYTIFYNKKYNRVGTLFQSRYKASRITSDEYLLHISRYIHLNPKDYMKWEFSSLAAYLGEKSINWLQSDKITSLFNNKQEYINFIKDHEDYKNTHEEAKSELANT